MCAKKGMGEDVMKAGIVFTGTGPILILTARDSLDDPMLVNRLNEKGIKKYIAFEVPVEKVKEIYGRHFSIVLGDFKQSDDLRVIDYDGRHVLNNFPLDELQQPILHEEEIFKKAA